MNDRPTMLFFVNIVDGYSFRNTMAIVKNETDVATMVLSPRKIEITFINISQCACHKIEINTSEIAGYDYNVRNKNGELRSEYPVSFDTNQFFTTIRNVTRRDTIRFYLFDGETKIRVQPLTNVKDSSQTGAFFVNIINKEYTRYESSGDYREEPNVRVQAKEFAGLCSQANTLKCNTVTIAGEENGIVLRGYLANKNLAFVKPYSSQNSALACRRLLSEGDEKEEDARNANLTLPKEEEGQFLVSVPIATIKALSKIHNISPNNTQLRFYFLDEKPTKLVSPIGTYGTYTICLRNQHSREQS